MSQLPGKSQGPEEIAANLSLKQKPKHRATAGQRDGQMHQTPLGDTKPHDVQEAWEPRQKQSSCNPPMK